MRRTYVGFWMLVTLWSITLGFNCVAQDLDAEAKLFVPAEGKAQVYIARDNKTFGGKRPFSLLVDGQIISKLSPGTYQMVVLSPGKHKIEVKIGLLKTFQSVEVKAGKNYYFSTSVKSDSEKNSLELTLVLFEKMGKLMISQSTRAELDVTDQEE